MPSTTSWQPAAEMQVAEPAAVEILWNPNKRIHLKPFLGRSNDLAGAAQELGIRKNAMSYWIDRLLEAGLIRLERVEKRLRHKVPVYRCVADRLRVPLEHAPLASYEDVFDEFSRRWEAQARAALAATLQRQAPELELHISHGGPAGIATAVLPRAGVRLPDDFIFYWGRLWLTPEEGTALYKELDALWDKYQALSDAGTKRHPVLAHLTWVAEPARR